MRKNAGREYWRSFDELADTPEFRQYVEAEFPSLAPELFATGAGGSTTRRQFLKIMGASLALAGLTGCRWPKETIVPATKQPGDRIPGVPVQYATAIELGGVAAGLLVTSYDGRPIKIEGNPKHPFSQGKTNHWMQASILDLYDPDRSTQPVERKAAGSQMQRYRTWDEFTAFARGHFAELKAKGGAGLAVLAEPSSSPTLADMKGRFLQAFPQAKWYEYEPLSRDNERAGARLAFGKPYRTHLHLDKADVIVSLDSDFLMTHPASLKYAADFAARRRADDGAMNRLYVLESNVTVTGSNADRRLAIPSSQIRRALEHIADEVRQRLGHAPNAPIPQPGGTTALDPATAGAIADDLVAHKGRVVVVVGPQQPPEAHAVAHVLNTWLNAINHTVTFTDDADAGRPSHIAAITSLAGQLQAGAVTTLVILGGNPAYTAPADLAFPAALAKVPVTIHLSLYDNETSDACSWHVPQAHYLEAWGDACAWDGAVSLVQPLIEPLYAGRTPLELLALLLDDIMSRGHDLVRRTFGNSYDAGGARGQLWEQSLHDGVIADSAWPAVTPTLNVTLIPDYSGGSGEELVFAADYSVYDGRFANNAWLQEWPDPITKLTWDNAALISPADAEKLGIKTYGDMLKIEVDGRSIEIPAYILPGHADGSITLPVGYGRGQVAGKVADGAGFKVDQLRTSRTPYIAVSAKVATTGRHYDLATTQDHHAIDSRVGREETQKRVGVLIREASLAEYKHEPEFAKHVVHLPVLQSLWQEKEYTGHKWGMAIDLTACIGCGACVTACQAENNVPVVGKDEVARGREMHWLRVDRYFREGIKGSRDQGIKDASASRPAHLDPSIPRSLDPSIELVHQPVPCMHCENAPCEQVCPVAATVHDAEGLNVQVYNRCVGTRYCSNNCPYKVRRFNWFYNHHGPKHPRSIKGDVATVPGKLKKQPLTEIEMMLNNPDVTVRSRGVMEKCTYCTQRINAVKIKAANERWDSIPDGLITPACAQACPTDAIVFGDLNDPNSRVRKLHEHHRAYAMLAELNVKPRTVYLAKLRNPAQPGE